MAQWLTSSCQPYEMTVPTPKNSRNIGVSELDSDRIRFIFIFIIFSGFFLGSFHFHLSTLITISLLNTAAVISFVPIRLNVSFCIFTAI